MPPRKKVNPKPSGGTPTHPAPGTTITIPLNDDDSEKARRNAKRQTLQEAQLHKIIAAATPRKSTGANDGGSPMIMSTPAARGGVNAVNAQTPVKKVPILANFEEWMKMATDNKINATNSWNFALIDYFHDMSLLKEGDSVNFQKASCTLDGCVKIYTSRVDSVATETGKLLSGLADNTGKKKGNQEEDGAGGEGEDGDDDDEEGGRKKARKRATRSEVTLAKDWSQLQLKKFDLEFAVDPLFKKAAADFDEGGAKGLLLNVLSIDEHGRIVFDSSDDVKDSTNTTEPTDLVNVEDGDEEAETEGVEAGEETMDHTITEASQAAEKKPKKEQIPEIPLDLDALAQRFFPDIDRIEELDVCPSLKNFALGDPTASLDIPFLKALTEKEEEELAAEQDNEFDAGGFDDDGDFGGGFDVAVLGGPETALYGQGGEAWANQTMGGEQNRGPMREVDIDGDGEYDVNDNDYIVKLGAGREAEQEDILAYFDEALKKNWAGPEHWKIRKIKEGNKGDAAPKPRKEKTPFTIDFVTPDQNLDDADALFATSNASINMPKTQLRHKGRNLLPDDKHFNSRQLLRLFLKPKAMLRSKKTVKGHVQLRSTDEENNDEMVMDEQFWAQNEIAVTSTPERQQGDYDANFFHDEPLGGMDDDDDVDGGAFADAREMFSPERNLGAGAIPTIDENGNPVIPLVDEKKPELGYGAQLVTSSRRIRPEYVQYARVAKKVDVRKLKETMWKGMLFESIDLPPQTPGKPPQAAPEQTPAPSEEPKTPPPPDMPRTFTTLMNGLKTYYPKQAMNDISTSYCFISLLHLANEKGLQIEGDGSLKELYIVRDPDAEVGGEY
ncbi:hypothetical protein TWF730_000256 [Orbilia blumenaviensis]|uniref:Condensin complex subunit 2 n=1 Tax=Orbilia blumenaviensis TaxID=1796055 RepID=A0AAV9VP64_9PEZI